MNSEPHTFWNRYGESIVVMRKTSANLPGLAIDRWDKVDVPFGLGRWVITHLPTDKRISRYYTYRDALRAAQYMAAHFDWSQPLADHDRREQAYRIVVNANRLVDSEDIS